MNEVSIPRTAGYLTALVVLLVALTASVAFAATISCPNGADNLCVGTNGPDDMQGSDENDVMRGFGGNDTVVAGLGNDTAHGGDGNDRLEGRIGNDFLSGGEGADVIVTADGEDEAYGAGGNDTIRAYRDDQPDFISCGEGDADTADVQSGDYVDGERAGLLVGTTVTSCEKVIVNGLVVVDRTGNTPSANTP
jgi:Ca2+-binding RTX toxin-like protein